MGRKAKFSFEIKIDTVQRYLAGKTSATHEAKLLGIDPARIKEWLSLYQSFGEDGLLTSSRNTIYSAAVKEKAVLDYLNGEGSYAVICGKYKIRSYNNKRLQRNLGVLTPIEKHETYLRVA